MDAAAHIIVRGMVQGVGFRYFAARRATGLGLTGFARNLYTGEVEIVVEGDRSLVEEFLKDIRVGPRTAHVADVKIQWKEQSHNYRTFEVH